MADGSDAVSDSAWFLPFCQTAAGVTWRRSWRRRGHGSGALLRGHCLRRLGRLRRSVSAGCWWNDPATGVMRHADAGHGKAIEAAKASGSNLPMSPRRSVAVRVGFTVAGSGSTGSRADCAFLLARRSSYASLLRTQTTIGSMIANVRCANIVVLAC